jgi:hypothetical protein
MGKTGYPMYVFIYRHTDFLSIFTMKAESQGTVGLVMGNERRINDQR